MRKIIAGGDRHQNMGAMKMKHLKKEVQIMWTELENTYNLELITKLENQLKEKKSLLLDNFEQN